MGLTATELTRWRMRSLGLTGPAQRSPADVAAHLVAVQSQDHGPSCWAIGQRTRRPAAADVDEAFDRGDLLRLHVLRPTWHTVARADVRWLVMLTGERVDRASARAQLQEGLTPQVLARHRDQVARALGDAGQLTRPQLGELLGTSGRRLAHLMAHLELTGLVCSGPRQEGRQTYALVADRAPHPRVLGEDEALTELGLRHATSHGPVTPHDLATWASLTVADARRAQDAAGLTQVDVDGVTHWHAPGQSLPRAARVPRWRLLQLYDELVVGYRHSGHVLGAGARTLAQKRAEPQALVMRDERVVGRWRRSGARVEVKHDGDRRDDVRPAVEELSAFLGQELEVVLL